MAVPEATLPVEAAQPAAHSNTRSVMTAMLWP